MFRLALITGAAVALLGCRTGTAYTPRTSGRAALAMVNGEPGIYKDGRLLGLKVAAMSLGCSQPASTRASAAADHHADYKRNANLSAASSMLGMFVLPLHGLAIYYAIRSEDDRQHAYAAEIDAINMHNDDAGCR